MLQAPRTERQRPFAALLSFALLSSSALWAQEPAVAAPGVASSDRTRSAEPALAVADASLPVDAAAKAAPPAPADPRFAVPEVQTLLIVGTGLVLIGIAKRRVRFGPAAVR